MVRKASTFEPSASAPGMGSWNSGSEIFVSKRRDRLPRSSNAPSTLKKYAQSTPNPGGIGRPPASVRVGSVKLNTGTGLLFVSSLSS